ncbi:MAG: glycoside hydrolase family 25, partial [Lachnospiraceae bacterium]|nr:glycoside hydrolase family 25 [Lachnospiraceae bacterium]
MSQQSGVSVNIEQVVQSISGNETAEITFGIDVARYQGTIDWKKVAESGVDFAIVRVGYRTLETGEIVADSNAKYNMQEASKYGIKVGVYFFSTAITKEEAIAEADWVADFVSQYRITYPVAYDCERFEDEASRQYHLTKTERTDFALAFLNRIVERGYSPMFYAGKSDLENEAKWETSRIERSNKIWVAQYPTQSYPNTNRSSYTGIHDIWQYTNQGIVSGIDTPVDMNIAYFGFRNTQNAQNSEAPEKVEADVEALMNFTEVNETVTAKEKTNLRDKPSQGNDSKVMYKLSNGETATRTGISKSGWSRIVLNGKTYYAVSSYLTTDLSYTPPKPQQSED